MTAEENIINPGEPEENEKEPLDYRFEYLHLCNVLENIISSANYAQKIAKNLYIGCEVSRMNLEFGEYNKFISSKLQELEERFKK